MAQPVYLRDIWPTSQEIQTAIQPDHPTRAVRRELRRRLRPATRCGTRSPAATSLLYAWSPDSTYLQEPPFFAGLSQHMPAGAGYPRRARAGHVRRLDHHRPHLPGREHPRQQPGREIPASNTACRSDDFNSYGSRRGNDRVMTRGTFANIRLKNLLLAGEEGSFTLHFPDGEQMTIYDAAMHYQAEGVPRWSSGRQGIRHRLQPRLGRQGRPAAGRARRPGRILRAHPPLQPGGHGRAAPAVQARRKCRHPRPDRARDLLPSPA